MPIELVDSHTHTVFSDGKSTFQENMKEALAKGITTIACTDHWGRPSFIDCSIEEMASSSSTLSQSSACGANFPNSKLCLAWKQTGTRAAAPIWPETRGNATFLLGSIHYLQEKALDWDEDMRIWEEAGGKRALAALR